MSTALLAHDGFRSVRGIAFMAWLAVDGDSLLMQSYLTNSIAA